jgi:hypothetical protein
MRPKMASNSASLTEGVVVALELVVVEKGV